jgi:hypothetical protein
VQGLAQKKYVLLQYPQSYTNLRIPSGPTKDSVGVTSSCMPCFSFFSQPISARPTVAASLCLCTGKGERREGEDGSEDLGLAARWKRGPRACCQMESTCPFFSNQNDDPSDGEKEERSGSLGFIIVRALVVHGETLNPNLPFEIKFCGSNHLIRRRLVGVIPKILKINLIHVMKLHRTMLFLFIVVFVLLNKSQKSVCYISK